VKYLPARTTRRLTFDPVDPQSFSRPISLPASQPVQAVRQGKSSWVIFANVEGYADYAAHVPPEAFQIGCKGRVQSS